MRSAYRLWVCLLLLTNLLIINFVAGKALTRANVDSKHFQRPDYYTFNFHFGSKTFRSSTRTSPIYKRDTILSLRYEVTSRLGLPYRSRGADDRGYDCSGFVWRVFHEAGIEFERSPARTLWATLPRATKKERGQFGTLVFFRGLDHVGIVRDARSFYHASSSRGVVRSNFEGYWENRIIGYRRALAPVAMRGR